MSKMTLSYFDFSGSRGEECRLALYLGGAPFEDDRIKPRDWPARKPTTPYGALPVLTIEGHPPIGQTNTILRMIGRKYGLHPADEWEAVRHESLMGATEDLRVKLSPIIRIKDPEEKKRARQEIASGYMQEWGGYVEKQIGDGPFFGGAKIQVADLKLYVTINAFAKGTIDYIPATVFSAFPKLTRLFEAARSHPKIVEWNAAHAG